MASVSRDARDGPRKPQRGTDAAGTDDTENTARAGVRRALRQPRKCRPDGEWQMQGSCERKRKTRKPESVGPERSKSGSKSVPASTAVAESIPSRRRRESRPCGETRRQARPQSAVMRASVAAPAREAGVAVGGASAPSVEGPKGDACLHPESRRTPTPSAASAAGGNARPSAPLEIPAALPREDSDLLGGTGSWVLPPSCAHLDPALGDVSSSEEEDDCLPSFFASLGSFEPKKDDLVWCKYQRFPYYPAVVKRVCKEKRRFRVMVLFFSLQMQFSTEKLNVFGVSVKHIKPFNCREKDELIAEARKSYPKEMYLYLELVTDYRMKMVSGSAVQKTFIEYCKSEMSASIWHGPSTPLPKSFRDLPESEIRVSEPSLVGNETKAAKTPIAAATEKRILPNRDEVLRRRFNERLVRRIVQGSVAEHHLRQLLRGAVRSQWLAEFREQRRLSDRCVSLYLEDDAHVKQLAQHLGEVYERERERCAAEGRAGFFEVDAFRLPQFILDVLLPEAVTYALMEMENITWEQARFKFLRGPKSSWREFELFNNEILRK